ncbi:MAG: glycosyltransferase family 4 protein [Halioglobus sp.]|nr:glycosyltransferase family 4 protein [Halioglobus sp.]
MNLIFNAESLRPPITGVGNYSFHLLSELMAQSLVDDVHSFTGTRWQDGPAQLAATRAIKAQVASAAADQGQGASRLRDWVGRLPGVKAGYDHLLQRRFERHANAVPNAVYHETNYILKPYAGPCVTTVHDLSHLRFPEFHPAEVVDWLERSIEASLVRADRVITVSEVVRDELLAHYRIPADRVSVIYEGVDEDYRPRSASETAPVLSSYGLRHGGYVLLVATLEPRKGIDVLLDAWAQLPQATRCAYPLVLTGSKGWRNESIRNRMETFMAEGSVKYLGYVPAQHLPPLFSGAAVFSYPSIYEGFGLPVLDAMSSGVPVICRAGTSMAEFSAGSCLLCDTPEAEELAAKITLLLEHDALRSEWGARGRERAGAFSWAQCARETAAVYAALA